MGFENGRPKPEYLERVKSLTPSEAFDLKQMASEDQMDAYTWGLWTKEEMLAVLLEEQDHLKALQAGKRSEPSVPLASS